MNLNKHMIFLFKLSPTLLCVDLRAVYTANAGDEAIAKTGRQKETKIFQNHQMYLNRINFRFWSHINPKIPPPLKPTQLPTLSTYQYRMLSSFNLSNSRYFIGELSCIKMIWCTSFCRTILHLISHLVYLPISLYVVQISGFFGDYDELVGISGVWKKMYGSERIVLLKFWVLSWTCFFSLFEKFSLIWNSYLPIHIISLVLRFFHCFSSTMYVHWIPMMLIWCATRLEK